MRALKPDSGVARTGRRARWGWLVTTLALGFALLGTAWANYRSVEQGVHAIIRGQAETMYMAVRGGAVRAWERDAGLRMLERRRVRGDSASAPQWRRLQRGPLPRPDGASPDVTPPDSAAVQAVLDSIVAEHAGAGLRFVGLLTPDGTLVGASGEPAAEPLSVPTRRQGILLLRLGDRVRSYFRPPARAAAFAFPILVLEFEPIVAHEMVARAGRTLAVSGIGAAILMLAALVFWRMTQRFEAAERRFQEQRRLSVLGEMSAVLAHEIRNPLASLKGHGQLLTEQLAAGTPERRKADRVVAEASRLEALTSDLLDFVRSGPLDVRPVDPVALVRASADEAAPGVDVRIDAQRAPATWPLDERRFRQVLLNLLRNAVQATTGDTPPTVAIARDDDRLVIVVSDRGSGLPAGDTERVFDPFHTTRTTGTGLGLPVARRIVEAHRGTIRAANNEDGGATFRIEIPGTD